MRGMCFKRGIHVNLSIKNVPNSISDHAFYRQRGDDYLSGFHDYPKRCRSSDVTAMRSWWIACHYGKLLAVETLTYPFCAVERTFIEEFVKIYRIASCTGVYSFSLSSVSPLFLKTVVKGDIPVRDFWAIADISVPKSNHCLNCSSTRLL